MLYPEFRGKGYWKDAENFCWKESLKKDFHRRKRKTCSLPDRPGGDRIVSETPRYCPEYGRKAFVSGFETLFTDIRIFSVVDRDNWSGEMYKYRDDIPEKYDDRPVYGIGMEDNPDADTLPPKRLVIVLSENEKEES